MIKAKSLINIENNVDKVYNYFNVENEFKFISPFWKKEIKNYLPYFHRYRFWNNQRSNYSLINLSDSMHYQQVHVIIPYLLITRNDIGRLKILKIDSNKYKINFKQSPWSNRRAKDSWNWISSTINDNDILGIQHGLSESAKGKFKFNKKIVNYKGEDNLNLIFKYNDDLNSIITFYNNKINDITNKTIFKFLKEEWNDVKWIISFKFDTVFTKDHKNILLSNLKKYIGNNKLKLLLRLILEKKILRVNYFTSLSKANIPEYDKLSKLLINVFFIKLDKKINDIKINFFEKYNNIIALNYLNYLDINKNNNINYSNSKINIKFVRYFDSFIIGIEGNKLQANEIKNEIELFLKSELLLKNVYSYLVDIHNDSLKFLNVIVSSGLDPDNNRKIMFRSDRYSIIKALINTGILDKKGRPLPMKKLLKYNINTLFSIFINVSKNIMYSFFPCQDFSSLFKFISYSLYCSLKLILQIKLNNNTISIKLLLSLGLLNYNTFRNSYCIKAMNKRSLKVKSTPLELIKLGGVDLQVRQSRIRKSINKNDDCSFSNINRDDEMYLYMEPLFSIGAGLNISNLLILNKNIYLDNTYTKKSLLNCKIIMINKQMVY